MQNAPGQKLSSKELFDRINLNYKHNYNNLLACVRNHLSQDEIFVQLDKQWTLNKEFEILDFNQLEQCDKQVKTIKSKELKSIVATAIKNSPHKKLTIKEISDWIVANVDQFNNATKINIRSNINKVCKKYFYKLDTKTRHSYQWTLKPDYTTK